MEEITVRIGRFMGATGNTWRQVSFEGEKLGEVITYTYGEDRQGELVGTRGVTQTLYRKSDGRLVVHVSRWVRWRGEPHTETLLEVTLPDLQPGGKFAKLGGICGFASVALCDAPPSSRGGSPSPPR